MAAWSDTAENKLVDWFFRAQAIGLVGATAGAGTGPANLYVGLLTAAPSDSTAGTEVSGNAYARVPIVSSLANWAGTQGAGTTVVSSGNSGTTSNNNVVTFPTPTPSGWGTVGWSAVYDSLSGGNLLFWAALTIAKVINAGDAVTFPAGSLSFQIDN